MKFDPTKPVKTRDGEKVRILASDLPEPWPIVAAIVEDGEYELMSYTASGKLFSDGDESPFDLINILEEREVWLNFYKNKFGEINSHSYLSKPLADRGASAGRIARVRVKFAEGQFDD